MAGLWGEAGLDACLFLLPPILALVPRGAAPLVAAAGLCAAGLLAAAPPPRFAGLRQPAALFAVLLLWGGLSAAWSIDPGRSLVLALHLAGLFAAALALAAAARQITAPRRLVLCLCAGTALGLGLAFADLASHGWLSRLVSVRRFIAPRLNPLAAWAAILVLPLAALLVERGRRSLAALLAAALAAAVFLLDDTTAKTALALSLPAAALLRWRASLARLAAALAVLAILTAPLTLPLLAHSPALVARVDAFKTSAGHRLLIWSFTGDRIAERPFLGWGLDAARAIPGGKDEIRPGQNWLPLHTHDAALQVWLELGAPGAALFALLVGWLWARLAAAPWPRLYVAAAGGSLTAALVIAQSAWGIWEEWWLATLSLALFAIIVAAPAAASTPRRRGWRGGGR
jgi:O-antigen ligase